MDRNIEQNPKKTESPSQNENNQTTPQTLAEELEDNPPLKNKRFSIFQNINDIKESFSLIDRDGDLQKENSTRMQESEIPENKP